MSIASYSYQLLKINIFMVLVSHKNYSLECFNSEIILDENFPDYGTCMSYVHSSYLVIYIVSHIVNIYIYHNGIEACMYCASISIFSHVVM